MADSLIQSLDSSAVDAVRPVFLQHVVSPILHFTIAEAFDRKASDCLPKLTGAASDLKQIWKSSQVPPPEALREIVYDLVDELTPGVQAGGWELFTPHQQDLCGRTTTFGTESDHTKEMVMGIASIAAAARLLHSRHPELGLDRPPNLSAFLRHSNTPSVLRGYMLGGNGFLAGLLRENQAPALDEWRNDPQYPVIETKQASVRTSRRVRRASHEHRQQILRAEVADGFAEDGNGLLSIGMRSSKGCPVRRLKFSTEVAALKDLGVDLTSDQIAALTSGERGIAIRDGGECRIVRDAVAETCRVFAKALDLAYGVERDQPGAEMDCSRSDR